MAFPVLFFHNNSAPNSNENNFSKGVRAPGAANRTLGLLPVVNRPSKVNAYFLSCQRHAFTDQRCPMYTCILLASEGFESGQKALLDCHEIAQLTRSELFLIAVMPQTTAYVGFDDGV